jgi:UPF0755 protein
MKRFLFGTLIAGMVILLSGAAFWGYRMLYASDFANKATVYIYIDNDTDFAQLCSQLTGSANCARIENFKRLAEFFKYPQNMKTGKYAIKPNTSHKRLLNDLRRGQQIATRITFNNIRLVDDLAGKLDEQLMLSKQDLLRLLKDADFCRSMGFSTETIGVLFIPNTYETYWNISAANLMQRMKNEYDAFWNDTRRQKAADIPLSPVEVSILASIVEEETAAIDEYPIVAGLYINRLRRGIPLQADPTVKFAVGDFALRRILFEHLKSDSPYNTYKYAGLPPGPLKIPSPKTIDAVLNHSRHRYIYMCAKEDFSGRHNFAETLSEHNNNANRYRAELDRRNIRR